MRDCCGAALLRRFDLTIDVRADGSSAVDERARAAV